MCTRQSRINGSKFVSFFLSFFIQERTADSLYTLSLLQADRAQIFHLGTILLRSTHIAISSWAVKSYSLMCAPLTTAASRLGTTKLQNKQQHQMPGNILGTVIAKQAHCFQELFDVYPWPINSEDSQKQNSFKKISLGRLSFLPFRETSRKANTRWYFNAWISPCVHLLQLWPS